MGGGCTREGGARNAGPRDGTEVELAGLQTRCSCSRQRPSPPPGRRPSPRRQPPRASPAPPRLRTQRRVTSRRCHGPGGARWARGRRWGGDREWGRGLRRGPSRRRGSAPGSRTRGVGREAGPSRGAGGTLTRADCGRVRSLSGAAPP